MKILVCFGTRPEAIKMAPVIHELQRRHIPYSLCVTAQHREMLDQVMDFFQLQAQYDLNLMQPSQSLNRLSAAILKKMDAVLEKEKPKLVLVHGDTTTSAMVALAAFHKNIEIGHIEAGLRTYNKQAPYPEEVNRQLTARLANWHFAPTKSAVNNLLAEHIAKENILLTGNTIVDALQWGRNKIRENGLPTEAEAIKKQMSAGKKQILVTGHRRENLQDGLEQVCKALVWLAKRKNVEIIFPVHLNPQVKTRVHSLLQNQPNIHLIPPVSYPTMLWLLEKASLVISDSGGLQEEVPSFGKMLLVTREHSERMEGVKAGFSLVVGSNKEQIKKQALAILEHPPKLSANNNPYGDGRASQKIVEFCIQHFLPAS